MRKKCPEFKEGWVAELVARPIATAPFWVRIQTSLNYYKWPT
jgi:hypothetical protein